VVPLPMSSESGVDPEEMLIAALSSCHMLTFLHLAKKAGLRVESYRDQAEGRMGKIGEGRYALTQVALRPEIAFSGERTPTEAELADLHHHAHLECFIANSVKTEVVIEPAPQRERAHA
jgi:organic hydroperoxide reductase OsmC/OhrA